LYTGDIAHTLLQFKHPEWAFVLDIDPAAASTTRKRVMEMAADEGVAVITYHLPFPGIGHVAKAEGAYRFVASPMEL
jgi:hypothetical protein